MFLEILAKIDDVMYYPILIIIMAVALIVIVLHLPNLPHMFSMIFWDAFDFHAILAGVSGSMLLCTATALMCLSSGVEISEEVNGTPYVDNALIYMNGKKRPGNLFRKIFYAVCVLIIFFGAVIPMGAAWAAADIGMDAGKLSFWK